MSSLTDLFTPTFFLILVIILLAVSGIVLYFENRMREQNHKISSMLSLVTTLAEDINNSRQSFFGGGLVPTNLQPSVDHVLSDKSFNLSKLITVSDGDCESGSEIGSDDETLVEDEEDGDEEDGDEEQDLEEQDLEELSEADSELSHDNVRVLKLDLEQTEDLGEDIVEGAVVEELLDEPLVEDNEAQLEVVLDEHAALEDGDLDEQNNDLSESTLDLKTIKINLTDGSDDLEEQDTSNGSKDYRKLSLNKLRNIVAIKGLASDPFKLKKHELLKLLGSD